jgi:hypothetical protein
MTQAYDEASKDVIAKEYAQKTHGYFECPKEVMVTAIQWMVDKLRPSAPHAAG